jgi:hypothetical protein
MELRGSVGLKRNSVCAQLTHADTDLLNNL